MSCQWRNKKGTNTVAVHARFGSAPKQVCSNKGFDERVCVCVCVCLSVCCERVMDQNYVRKGSRKSSNECYWGINKHIKGTNKLIGCKTRERWECCRKLLHKEDQKNEVLYRRNPPTAESKIPSSHLREPQCNANLLSGHQPSFDPKSLSIDFQHQAILKFWEESTVWLVAKAPRTQRRLLPLWPTWERLWDRFKLGSTSLKLQGRMEDPSIREATYCGHHIDEPFWIQHNTFQISKINYAWSTWDWCACAELSTVNWKNVCPTSTNK